MNDKLGAGIGIGVGAAAVVGLLYFAFAPVEDAEIETNRDSSKSEDKSTAKITEVAPVAKKTENKGKPSSIAKRPRRPPKMEAPKDWFENLPAKDRNVAKRIQDAQDADDQAAVFAAAEDALSSKNDEVRESAVSALSLQGEAAMPYLLKFVGDRNANVADSAYRAWDDAVDGVDGDLNKLAAIKTALPLVQSEEHIKSAVGKIEMFDQSRAIRELAKLARGDGKAAEAARESYENVTGEPFESWAAAELKAIAIDSDNAEANNE